MKRSGSGRGIIVAELILVVTITGLVTGVYVWKWGERVGATRVGVAKSQITEFCKALWLYYHDMGNLPADSEGLLVLVRNPGTAGWRGPYLAASQLPRDPWGCEYRYLRSGEGSCRCAVLSAGPDGRFDTGDDIMVTLGAPGSTTRPAPVLLAGRVRTLPPHSWGERKVKTHEAIC